MNPIPEGLSEFLGNRFLQLFSYDMFEPFAAFIYKDWAKRIYPVEHRRKAEIGEQLGVSSNRVFGVEMLVELDASGKPRSWWHLIKEDLLIMDRYGDSMKRLSFFGMRHVKYVADKQGYTESIRSLDVDCTTEGQKFLSDLVSIVPGQPKDKYKKVITFSVDDEVDCDDLGALLFVPGKLLQTITVEEPLTVYRPSAVMTGQPVGFVVAKDGNDYRVLKMGEDGHKGNVFILELKPVSK